MKRLFYTRYSIVLDIIFILFGTSTYALGVHMFTVPNKIAPGGVTGLATVINYLTNLPIGTLVLVINIPLFILGLKFLGKRFMLKSALSLVWFSFIMDVVYKKIPVYQGDKFLAAIFGGICIGIGLGVVFTRGGSTGGMDITNRVIQSKIPHMPLGKVIFTTDSIIIIIASIIFGNIDSMLYAIITMFVTTKVIDTILYGLDIGKMVFIVSDYHQDIAKEINHQIKRGVTLLDGEGAYSGTQRKVILCAISQNQYYKVKKMVHFIDPNAFMIVANSGEVLGEGFKSIDK